MKQLIIMAFMLTATLVGGVSRVQAAPPPDPWEIIVSEAVREDSGKPEKVPPEQRPAAEHGDRPIWMDIERHFAGEMHGPPVWERQEGCLPCLAKALALTDAQKKQIAAFAHDDRDKDAPLLKKRDEIHRQLRQAERAATFDEKAVRSIAGNLAQVETDLIVFRAKAHNRIRAVLTPVQRAIMENMAPEAECRPGPPPGGREVK
jgi:Spy/CpxP family protein refolding chaperone